jgi:hypothetical protein
MAKRKKSVGDEDSRSVRGTEIRSTGNGDRADGESRERIAARAYELYLQRGGTDGRAFEDWLEAEREVSRLPDQLSRE